MKTKHFNERGFVALMSVIVMSAVLLVLLVTLNTSSFFSRFDALDSENKRVSTGLAESCVSALALKLAQNPNYVPIQPAGDCVSVTDTCGVTGAQKICRICSVATSGIYSTSTVRALYNGAYTTFTVAMNTTPGSFSITYWSELQNYGPTCQPVP